MANQSTIKSSNRSRVATPSGADAKTENTAAAGAAIPYYYTSDRPVERQASSSPPAYSSIYPPSPPSSASSSPCDSVLSKLAGSAPCLTVPLFSPPTLCDAPITAPSLLQTVFPASSSIHALPSFAVDLTSVLGNGWKGVVVDHPLLGTRTLYVGGGKFEDVELRDSVCAVLDQAEEEWGASGVVLCLEKGNNKGQLGMLVHQLMYIGCTVVNNQDDNGMSPNPAYLLLGMDL
ncbi:SPOSA6832_02974, partial [Sporobolomyces salmonicolor]